METPAKGLTDRRCSVPLLGGSLIAVGLAAPWSIPRSATEFCCFDSPLGLLPLCGITEYDQSGLPSMIPGGSWRSVCCG